MKNDREKLKMRKSLGSFAFFVVIFTFSFLLFYFEAAHAQTQFINISWKVLNAPHEQTVKNLPVDASTIAIGVTYKIVEQKKVLTDADVDFTWRIEPDREYVIPNAPVFVLSVDRMQGQNSLTVSLQIKSKGTGNVYQKSIVIPIVDPEVVLLKYDRSLDLSYPFDGFISRSARVFDIIARPFYFTSESELLNYSWRFNGQYIMGSPQKPQMVSFDIGENPLGRYELSLDLSNLRRVAQYLIKTFTITITQ